MYGAMQFLSVSRLGIVPVFEFFTSAESTLSTLISAESKSLTFAKLFVACGMTWMLQRCQSQTQKPKQLGENRRIQHLTPTGTKLGTGILVQKIHYKMLKYLQTRTGTYHVTRDSRLPSWEKGETRYFFYSGTRESTATRYPLTITGSK
jgi:hypothetical protein